MKFTAVGDAIIQQKIRPDFCGISEIMPYIMQGDARFFNLETTLGVEGDSFASQFSGGTYLRADPEVLDEVKKFGFNMTTFNNNHTLDFSYSGLYSTLEKLKTSGLVHTGVGLDIERASAPAFLKTENGTVALISVNTTFEPSMMAGKISKLYPGRPGINGLRIKRIVNVTQEDINNIRAIASKTQINAEDDCNREGGYLPPLPDDTAQLGDVYFKAGDSFGLCESVYEEDLLRVKKAIDEANSIADYTIISVHSHNMDTRKLELPPKFLIDFCHWSIDNGANAVIGHGPHLLRPIEVYKDSPIFYSLGDFILELYSVPSAPEDFYNKYGLTSDSSVYELLKKRSKNFTRGLMEDDRMLRTVVPYWETDNRKLKTLKLLPVSLIKDRNSPDNGLPRISKDNSYMDELAQMSAPFGVKIKPDDDGNFICEW